jgi:hypothetical protein
MYTDCGHVTKDKLNTLLRWLAGYKLWLSGLVGTTMECCQMSHEIIGVTTSRQVWLQGGQNKLHTLINKVSWFQMQSQLSSFALYKIGHL